MSASNSIFTPRLSRLIVGDLASLPHYQNGDDALYTMPCVLKTPAAGKGMFPEVGPIEIPLRMLVNLDTDFLIEVGYISPLDPEDMEPYSISLFMGENRIYEKLNSSKCLEPYASGGFHEGVYRYTLNPELTNPDSAMSVTEAHSVVRSALKSWLVLPPHIAMRERETLPYLLVSFSTGIEDGQTVYTVTISVEQSDTNVSVTGAQLARWPLWAYEDAVADAMARISTLRQQLRSSGGTASGEVILVDYVQYINSDIKPEHQASLDSHFQKLSPLAA